MLQCLKTLYILVYTMFLIQLIDTLEEEKINYCLVGGYALALQGLVRATVDVDIVISLDLKSLEKVESALKKINLESRIPVRAKDIYQFREEYIKNKNLVAWSFINPINPTEQLDILIIYDLKDIKSQQIKALNRKIKVATLESLLKLKSNAGRPQDLLDIQKIEELIKQKNKKA